MNIFKSCILVLAVLFISCKNTTENQKVNEVALTKSTNPPHVDSINFHKVLSQQNTSFVISTKGEGSIQQLILEISGLELDNNIIRMDIDGAVTNAEMKDLNADGYPELLIYTVSAGSGSYGNVIGYSVNHGKTISRIYIPDISNDEKVGKGYMGHDEFAIVENTLVHTFPIYNPTDMNNNPTGGVRQIRYKLNEGEAPQFFIIDKIIDTPSKE